MDEVAMFIDLENLRYGLLNDYGQEPDFTLLVEKAKKYGRPSMMRAYADFAEHPSELNKNLQLCGVESINIPVTRKRHKKNGETIERIKNAADMALALDAITQAVEADANGKVKTFLIVAGDRDYIRLITLLRNKFGQRTIICGVPGSISADLETAAGEIDHIIITKPQPTDINIIKTELVQMVKKGPSPLQFWTSRIIDQWAQSGRQKVSGSASEKRDAISALLKEGVLYKQEQVMPNSTKKVDVTVLSLEEAEKKGYLT